MAQVHIFPHEIGMDLIPELATRVYSSQLDSFREAISNAFDEDSKHVALSMKNDRIVIEDWGNGIKDYDEFRSFGQSSKKRNRRRDHRRKRPGQAFAFEPWKFRLL